MQRQALPFHPSKRQFCNLYQFAEFLYVIQIFHGVYPQTKNYVCELQFSAFLNHLYSPAPLAFCGVVSDCFFLKQISSPLRRSTRLTEPYRFSGCPPTGRVFHSRRQKQSYKENRIGHRLTYRVPSLVHYSSCIAFFHFFVKRVVLLFCQLVKIILLNPAVFTKIPSAFLVITGFPAVSIFELYFQPPFILSNRQI